MGLFTWLSSCGTVVDSDEPPSLIHYNDEDSDLDATTRAAAEDVARVEQDGTNAARLRWPDQPGSRPQLSVANSNNTLRSDY